MIGGSLATELDEDSYRLLNSCCNSQHQYWIGLLNKPNSCKDAGIGQNYQWLKRKDCKSAYPLQLVAQPNNQRCQGITVHVTTPNQFYPKAYEIDCSTPNRYICQLPVFSPANPYTRSTSLPANKPTNLIPGAVTSNNESILLHQEPSLNVAAIVGGVLGLLFLFILFVFIYRCFTKQKNLKSKKDNEKYFVDSVSKQKPLPIRSPSQKSCHIYCT